MAVNSVKSRALHRTVLMYGFHCLVYLFCTRNVRDTQCGFKLFRRDTAQRIFRDLHLERWAFDIELIYLAEALHFTIVEVSYVLTFLFVRSLFCFILTFLSRRFQWNGEKLQAPNLFVHRLILLPHHCQWHEILCVSGCVIYLVYGN